MGSGRVETSWQDLVQGLGRFIFDTIRIPNTVYNPQSNSVHPLWHTGAVENQQTISNKLNHNLSIPLARLPVEILIIIFEHCIKNDSSGHAFSKIAMPWVLSQVCSQWRSICLYNPSLWVIVRVKTRLLEKISRYSQSLCMLHTWLERSRPLPISCLVKFDPAKPLTFHLHLLDLFIRESQRWLIVDFSLGSQAELYYRLSSVGPYLPFLHSSRFTAKLDDARRRLSGNPRTHTWHAPRLRQALFTVRRSRSSQLPIMEIVPSGTQLEKISFVTNTPTYFLNNTPNLPLEHLRYCHLDITNKAAIPSTVALRFTAPNLQHLSLLGHVQSVLMILDNLILPALRYLIIDFRNRRSLGTESDRVLSALGDLQARSRCQLYHLSSPFLLFSSPDAPIFAKRFGPVIELRLLFSIQGDNKTAFNHFTHAEIFNHVTTLHIVLCEHPQDEPTLELFAKVVDMVEYRQAYPSQSHLERLSFDSIRSSEKDGIPVHVQPVQRILELARANGVLLLGREVNGKWFSSYINGHWRCLDFDRAVQQWSEYCD
ncbi:hypothetical protein VNI00_016321 [Paramarasmius palmivorus]|uniref:F-box domain-containing protein n=1 Tax=Paramarasmius palmivorus TaxID=297713 RepID=A0AAW0BE13_9AGAR